nr:tetratricopeptide repeat protein [Granulosicoccus sp.]
MANELGDQRQAMSWNQRLLDMYPNDYSALTLQVDLALATSNLPVALQNVKQLVRVSPDDPEVRTRIARISEWNGELAAAVLHWHWLTDRRNQSNEEQRLYALRQLVRLSALNNDVATAARAQRELSLLTDPDDQLVSDLVSYFVQDGRPKEASVALNDLLIVHGPLEFAIRRLADHEYSYGNYRESLAAWNQLEQHHGRTSESILHRVELLWRLDRKADAVAAAGELQRRNLLSQANDYQVRLLAEIAWQYDMQWLGEMVGPRILSLDKRDMRAHYGRRAVQALRTAGNDQQAIEESVKLWRNTGDEGFAIGAMSMALKVSDQNVLGQFSPGKHGTEKLQSSPDYWVQLAAVRLRDANNDGARAAYLQALELDTQSADAAAGLIWLDIGSANSASLQETINTYRHLADDSPVMWQAMAVAYLQLGAASTSLSWFEKSLDQIRTDYGMLLTYADALEYAGMAAEALRVREYTLNRLRPLLVDATEQERDLLLRQYAKLSARYAGVSHSDELVNYLLGQEREGQAVPEEEVIWREDIAISWLMSSQQLEQARVVMANLHSKRLQAPVWQHMALALKDNDSQAIKELVQASGPLSIGNHILALRQLGNDKEAYGLAQMALNREHTGMALTPSDLEIAAEQYAYLRQVLPSFVSGEVSSRQFDQLSASERGFHIRHSVTRLGIGFGLRASERTVDSQRFMLDGLEHRSDVALSLYLGNSRRGASITSGFMSTDRLDVAYAQTRMYQRSADRRRELALEMAYNEPATQSPELLLAGLQHRVSLSIDTALGRLPYARFQTDATQIRSREDRLPVADGLSNQIELGLRGSLGRHQWSTSVQAGHIRYDRRDELPEPLRLSGTSSMDSVLAREVQSLSVGGFIERGGVNRNFPTISSPRYFLNARVHHYWPRKQFGFQLGAGAGIRVLGGDELSFTVNHDTQALQADPQGDTSLGVNYRYHF